MPGVVIGVAFSALIPAGVWRPVGPVHWVRYRSNDLGDASPVRFTVHSDPFAFHHDDLVQGLTIQSWPPESSDFIGGPL